MINYAMLESRLGQDAIKADLGLSHLGAPVPLLGRLLLGPSEIRQYTDGANLNTDDHPVIEFLGPRSFGKDTRSDNLAGLVPYLASITSYVDFSGLPPERKQTQRRLIESAAQARDHFLRGLVYDFRNDFPGAIAQYEAALAATPGDPDIQTKLSAASARLKSRRL
jgi:hypothetical protein